MNPFIDRLAHFMLQPREYDDHPTPVYYNPMFYPQPMNQEAAMHSYLQNDHSYVPYQTPQDTFNYPSNSFFHEYEAYLEERLIMLDLEDGPELQLVNNADTSGSGLSEEEISKHLHVYIAQGEMNADCEVETCSICLDDCEKKEKIGRLECGHRFHEDCIKGWLLSKNVCPMCRSIALTV